LARKKFVPCTFIEACPICRKPMTGRLNVGGAASWLCERHGEMEREQQERIPYRRQTTGMGECVVVETMEVVDTYPEILASLLPVFLDDEMPILKNMTPAERAVAWIKREQAMDAERKFRATDSSRDVYGKSWDGKDKPA
jgi:hypothetical protein